MDGESMDSGYLENCGMSPRVGQRQVRMPSGIVRPIVARRYDCGHTGFVDETTSDKRHSVNLQNCYSDAGTEFGTL